MVGSEVTDASLVESPASNPFPSVASLEISFSEDDTCSLVGDSEEEGSDVETSSVRAPDVV